MKMFSWVTALVMIGGQGGLVLADDVKSSSADEEFLVKAVSCGVAEVKFSEFAEKHASKADVKSFAQHLAKEHARLNKELLEKARGIKTGVVTGLDKERKEKFDKLSKLEGTDFDREYLQQMIMAHQDAIKAFEDQAKNGTHADLKSFASETLPSLRAHLKKAHALSDSLKN